MNLYDEAYTYLSRLQIQSESEICINFFNVLQQVINQVASMEYHQASGKMTKVLDQYFHMAKEVNKPLKVLIAGEFKTGKSTFINLLLGRDLLKQDIIPTTAVLTYIEYGETESIRIIDKAGREYEYPIQYLHDVTSEGNAAFKEWRNNTQKVIVSLPLEFLKAVTIIDSPGINVDLSQHIKATANAFSDADFIIWIMSISQAAKKGELAEIRKLPKHLKPLVIFNRIDYVDEEEETVDAVLSVAGEKVKQDSIGYFGISAILAIEAISKNKYDILEASRWLNFRNYFVNELCGKWFEKKYLAVKGNFRNLYDEELANQEQKYVTRCKEIEKWLKSNNCNHIFQLKDCINKRNTVSRFKQMSVSPIVVENLLEDQISNEMNQISSLFYCIQLLYQEMQIVPPVNGVDKNTIQQLYQFGYQKNCYLQYYIQYLKSCEADKNTAYQYVQMSVNEMINFNQQSIAVYNEIEIRQNQENSRFIKENEERLHTWNVMSEEYEAIGNRIENMRLWKKINYYMEQYYGIGWYEMKN